MPSRSHRPAHTVADLSPITERTQAAVEREEEIKEAMNDALGASTRRITDLEGELEHAKAIAAVADKSPSSQGAPDGTDAAELEQLRKKLKVSAGLVKKLRDNETGLKDELATAQKRIAEPVLVERRYVSGDACVMSAVRAVSSMCPNMCPQLSPALRAARGRSDETRVGS